MFCGSGTKLGFSILRYRPIKSKNLILISFEISSDYGSIIIFLSCVRIWSMSFAYKCVFEGVFWEGGPRAAQCFYHAFTPALHNPVWLRTFSTHRLQWGIKLQGNEFRLQWCNSDSNLTSVTLRNRRLKLWSVSVVINDSAFVWNLTKVISAESPFKTDYNM